MPRREPLHPHDADPRAVMLATLREIADRIEDGTWEVEREDMGSIVIVRLGIKPHHDQLVADHCSMPGISVRVRVHCGHAPGGDRCAWFSEHLRTHQHGGHSLIRGWWCSVCRELHDRGYVCTEQADDDELVDSAAST